MNEILTHNDKMVSPFNPDKDDILIDDIAHALSYLCRANGHFHSFYSVAQHSINCALEAKERGLSEKIQLGCLLHDGAEAYMADIPKPVKDRFPEFSKAEDELMQIIFEKFVEDKFTEKELAEIFMIDNILLNEEFIAFKGKRINSDTNSAIAELDFEERSFTFYKNRFLSIFYSLSKDSSSL